VRPLFAGHPVAASLVFGSLMLWALGELRQALRRRSEAKSGDAGSLAALRLSAIAGALLAALALKVRAAEIAYSPVLLGACLAAIWIGIAIRWWSFFTLGRYFTLRVMTSGDQPVITTGPYRFLRHPSYLGLLLVIAGLGFTYGNWLSLAALVLATLVGLVNRIRVEESALTGALGAAYTTYAEGRKRLLPLVW
jgi:protein-S-isoprenylcysteine O-methyltransferase Ste14